MREDLERVFARAPAERDDRLDVEGEIPPYVRGTYYVIGPGSFRRGELRYRNWLDGDGLVCALHLGRDGDGSAAGNPGAGGGARFVSRYVHGTKRLDEEEAGRPLYRAFGTAFDGDRLKRGLGLESPLNVSVHPWRGQLLAFGEQGLPWALDPITLETRGEHVFGGRLNAVSPFSAHPSFDPETGEMVNFGISFAPKSPSLTLYHLAPDGDVRRNRVPLEHPYSVHDFALTPRYAIFYLSPYVLELDLLLRQGKTLLEALAWRPELGSRLLVLERDGGRVAANLALGEAYCLHVIGAFEQERERLVFDVVELDRPVYDQYQIPELFPEPAVAEPVRYFVDLAGPEIVARLGFDYHEIADFPHVDPRRWGTDYRHFWMLGIRGSERSGCKFFDQLVHGDWRARRPAAVYQAPPGRYFAGEPAFAPDPASDPGRRDAGAIIVPIYDARRDASEILIFDAFDLAAGPLATVTLRAPVPPLFHATFVQG